MKKVLSFIISLSLMLSIFTITSETTVYATEFEKDINYFYSGVIYDSVIGNRNCELSIYHISDTTFQGHLKLDSALLTPEYDIDVPNTLNNNREVTTTITGHNDYGFSCSISIPKHNGGTLLLSFNINPLDGTVTGEIAGELLTMGLNNFTMTGTVDRFYADGFPYEEKDMKMCMDLSNAIYDKNEVYDNFSLVVDDYHLDFCLEDNHICNIDNNKNNVLFSMLKRTSNNNSIDIIVVIRGTYKDEWQGNVEITGQSYNADIDVHDNFEKAKDSIKDEISNYYTDYCSDYDKVNLIITGHSRGAAVANLYAKYATDVMNDTRDINAPEGAYVDIPEFDSVTAYTFACPNNAKITTEHSESYMKSYDNIFNFWFDSDIVPLVPPREPEDGWNYWKYGQCYTMDISDYYAENNTYSFMGYYTYDVEHTINNNVKKELANAFSQWPSVDDYYNKRFVILQSLAPNHNELSLQVGEYVSLYDFLHSGTAILGSHKFEVLSAVRYLSKCRQFDPLVVFALSNIYTIKTSHLPNTYNEIINTGNADFSAFGDSGFSLIDYNSSRNLRDDNSTRRIDRNRNNEVIYNATEVQKLITMANHSTNNDVLDWDLSDPSTWEGVTWNSDGNVTKIDLKYKWLTGTLDCSNFTALTDLNIYGNSFTSLYLSGDTSLTSLNCGFNDFSSSGLTLTDCIALTDLFCDGCGLTTINLSTLTNLEMLSCSFNNLIALDILYNTSLEHIACIYNYLDISANSTLYTALNGYKTANNAYLNYYPQRITENAVVDADEMQALKNFANTGNNNQILDWLDGNGDISLEKLQYYALFEYDGTKYRVAALDLSALVVTGNLDLDSFSALREFYCENTSITALDLTDCTSLEVLNCYNCEIETFNLPSNITSAESPLYNLDCEYNHIDTTIFTQAIIDNISSKDDYVLEYENQKWEDDSALAAVIEFSQGLNSEDYSEESFEVLSDLLDTYEDYENYLLTQDDIDDITAEFLTAISDLEPYLKLKLSCENGTVTTVYDGDTQSGNTHSILFGESVTLTATPDTNYAFDGWYEKVTKRIYSTNSTYTFPMTTNLDFEARFVKQNAAILSFTNDTGQIVAKYDYTPTEWLEITTLEDLLPDVPYKFQHTNGRWNYIESDVLTSLRAGNDVTITPVYDPSSYVYPDAPLPVDGNPVLNLTFTYDETNDVGSYIMGAGLPQNLDVESIGIAFYFKNKNTFNPENYILNINNKAVVSRFDNMNADNRHIVNVHRFTEKYNWCARGFVTYRENGQLKIAYSNQLSITNTVQNNRNVPISKSDENEPPYHIHNIDDED